MSILSADIDVNVHDIYWLDELDATDYDPEDILGFLDDEDWDIDDTIESYDEFEDYDDYADWDVDYDDGDTL